MGDELLINYRYDLLLNNKKIDHTNIIKISESLRICYCKADCCTGFMGLTPQMHKLLIEVKNNLNNNKE